MKKEVGNRIRKIREEKDYTQENIADELGISHSTYAKIERGETDPQVTRLYQIAKVLKVDITELFRETKPTLHDPTEKYGFVSRAEFEELKELLQKIAGDVEGMKRKR